MIKLCSGKEVCPFPKVVGTEDVEICFDLLIGSFCLSICLRVICGGEFDIIVKGWANFLVKADANFGPLSDIREL